MISSAHCPITQAIGEVTIFDTHNQALIVAQGKSYSQDFNQV
jgi:hypothetical protein